MGDNSNVADAPQEITEAVFLAAVRQNDKFEMMFENLRKAKSRFRKDLMSRGFKMKTFDAVLTLRGLERKEIVEDVESQFRMMRWLKINPGKQADLFPKEAEPVTEDAAFLDGFNKGVKGEGERKPPDEFASGKQQQSWLKGWDYGQAKLAGDMFGGKDYFDPALDEEEGEARGPGDATTNGPTAVAEIVANNIANLDKAREDKQTKEGGAPPPTTPAKPRTQTDDTITRVADRKKAEKEAKKNAGAGKGDSQKNGTDVVKDAATRAAARAADQAANGGVKGQAPPGARKGGGDFDDNGKPITPAAEQHPAPPPAAAEGEGLGEDDEDLEVDDIEEDDLKDLDDELGA